MDAYRPSAVVATLTVLGGAAVIVVVLVDRKSHRQIDARPRPLRCALAGAIGDDVGSGPWAPAPTARGVPVVAGVLRVVVVVGAAVDVVVVRRGRVVVVVVVDRGRVVVVVARRRRVVVVVVLAVVVVVDGASVVVVVASVVVVVGASVVVVGASDVVVVSQGSGSHAWAPAPGRASAPSAAVSPVTRARTTSATWRDRVGGTGIGE